MDKHIPFKPLVLPGLIASALMLSACGGGGSGSDSGDTTLVPSSRGVITGFGSVYVNGVKYETDDSEFEVDDDSTATQASLSIGQYVTVYGTINADGTTGTASKISYENEIQGPISNKTPDGTDPSIGTMEILGIEILVNLDTRFDDNLTFADFNDGDFAEISGFTTDAGITATYIEKEDDTEIEIVGVVADLTDSSFTVRGITINYDNTTEIDDDFNFANDAYVEVKGALDPLDNTAVKAEKIEAEDDGKGDDDHEFEIQGVVSGWDDVTETFMIGSIKIDASATNLIKKPSSLDLGADPAPEVEVEGHWLDGVLVAKEIEQKGKKIKIEATTAAADASAGTVTFNFHGTDIVVNVDSHTEMEDEAGDTPLEENFTLANLNPGGGDFVEIEAYDNGTTVINAIELERKDPDEVIVQAPVESADQGTESVTMLGVVFNLGGAEYKDDELTIDIDIFYGALDTGVFVKIKDSEGDGTYEQAELED